MIGAQVPHHRHLVRALVELRLVEGDREGTHRSRCEAAHQGHDARGIQAAAQVGADRHVGAQLQAHGVHQALAQFAHGLVDAGKMRGARLLRRGEDPVPVARERLPAVRLDCQQVPRRQALHPFPRGVRIQRRPIAEGLQQPGHGQARVPRQGREQRPRLRGEPQRAAGPAPVQRPDAGAVARQHQPPAFAVPKRDRKLAVEVFDEAVAVAVVQVDDHLGVGTRVEHVPPRLEVGAQFDEVEDLAVEDRPHRARRVVDRLVASGQVDDRQPRVRQPHAGPDMEAVAVGPPVRQGADHPFQQRPFRANGHGVTDVACQPAHASVPSARGRRACDRPGHHPGLRHQHASQVTPSWWIQSFSSPGMASRCGPTRPSVGTKKVTKQARPRWFMRSSVPGMSLM